MPNYSATMQAVTAPLFMGGVPLTLNPRLARFSPLPTMSRRKRLWGRSIMSRFLTAGTIAASCVALACSANAALPTVDLAFTTPSGTVGPNDSVEVWVTMSIPSSSSALAFDESAPDFGLDPADLPSQGYYDSSANPGTMVWADFTSYSEIYLNTWFGCSGTFTASCIDGPPYDFSFHLSSLPGKPSVNFLTSFDLQPGQQYSYLFGVFTPSAGPVAAGTYTFERTGLTLNFVGLDADGNTLHAEVDWQTNCGPGDTSCLFTRTVTAVPEVSTWASMSIGLLLVGSLVPRLRRRELQRCAA